MDNWNGIASLFIACIELVLLINLLVFVKKDKFNTLSMLMVFILMVYQTLEFLMCQLGLTQPFMPFLAFADISLLPPLNLFIVLVLLGYKNKLYKLIFLPALGFIIYYLFVIDNFAVTSCSVFYASYHYPLGELFGFFYYIPILISMYLLYKAVTNSPNDEIKYKSKILLIGNVIISLPVVIGFILMFTGNYIIISKIESIMCKFAFIYAICLALVILYNPEKTHE